MAGSTQPAQRRVRAVESACRAPGGELDPGQVDRSAPHSTSRSGVAIKRGGRFTDPEQRVAAALEVVCDLERVEILQPRARSYCAVVEQARLDVCGHGERTLSGDA